MKKYITCMASCFLTILCLMVCYELVLSVQSLRQNKVNNNILMKFIQINKGEEVLDKSIRSNITSCCLDIFTIFLTYVLLKVFQNLSLLDNKISNENSKELQDCEMEQNKTEKSPSRLLSFLRSKNKVLFFVSFINLLIISGNAKLEGNLIGHICSALVCFWFYLKFNVWVFKKIGISKSAIVWVLFLIFEIQNKTYRFGNLSLMNDPESVVPGDIIQHLKENNIKYNFYEAPEMKTLNFFVFTKDNIANFVIGGNHKILTKNELTAVLYHEIGHLVNNSRNRRNTFLCINACLAIFAQLFFLSQSKKLSLKNFSTFEKYFIYECVISGFILIIHKIITNILFQYDETLCDAFSRSKLDPIHLANVLLKMTFSTIRPLIQTAPYNYWQSDHPTIISRLKYLGFN